MKLRLRRREPALAVPPPIPCACPPGTELVPTPDGAGFVHLPPCPFAAAHPVTVVHAVVRTDGNIDLGDIPAGFRGGVVVKVDGNAGLSAADMARITDRIRVKLASDEPELCPMAPYAEQGPAEHVCQPWCHTPCPALYAQHVERNKREIAAAFGVSRASLEPTPGELGPDPDAPPACPGCGFRHPGTHPAKPEPSWWEQEREAAAPFLPDSHPAKDEPLEEVAVEPRISGATTLSGQPAQPTAVETAVQLAVRLDREANQLSSGYRRALQRADEAWRVIGGRP